MFEAFYWIFKTEGVKQQIFYLLGRTGILIALYLIIIALSFLNPILLIVNPILLFIFGLLICFLWSGYYWELTEQIIGRDFDVVASTVYDGRIKNKYNIELPELSFKKFIWRGFASFIATLILIVPYVLLIAAGIYSIKIGSENALLGNIRSYLPIVAAIALSIFLFPALMWNYAVRNSIIAVLNIRKAIFIIGNYTGKYLWNVFLMFALNILINGIFLIAENSFLAIGYFNTNLAKVFLIFVVLVHFITVIYQMFVNAYLLGTITPPAEG